MGKMNMTDEQIEALKAAALAATPQNIDGAEIIGHSEDGGRIIECPVCGGEGTAVLEGEYCNYDREAIGVQFYGIGNAHGAAEAYFRAASPVNVLALIERLERAEGALLSASKPAALQGFAIKRVEGHGWVIDPPSGSRWVAYEGTPAGELIQALAASSAAPAQSYWTRDQIAAVREDAERLHAKLTHRPLVDDAPEQSAEPEPGTTEYGSWINKEKQEIDFRFAFHREPFKYLCAFHQELRKLAAPPEQTAQSEAVGTIRHDQRRAIEAALDGRPLDRINREALSDLLAAPQATATPPAQTERALTEVGFIVQDDVRGWHFAPTVAWTHLGKGRALYAMTTAQPTSGGDHD